MAGTTASVVNLSAVRALIEDRQEAPSVRRRFSPEPAVPRGGVEAGQWQAQACSLGLPPGCPVKPLGVTGPVCWFLDPIGQVQSLAKYGKGDILGLFLGDENFLAWAWPRWKPDRSGGGIDGYAAEKASAALLSACAALGPWNSVEKVRGRGAWQDAGGELLLHAGTTLVTGSRRQPPGAIDGFVYPTRPELPLPWPQVVEVEHNPARLLRPLLRTWSWARPEVDPHLLLGWIGAAFLGGALAWRPTVYITGDKATGKSTLQQLIKGLLGDYLIQAVDTTGAGIYQHIGNDSLAIAVDELEGEADVRKAKAVLKLARIAASGGLMLRGGDRHNPVEFRARSCFLFSSINTPPLEPQDLSRMALLRLHRLPEGATSPALDVPNLALVGRMILRRLVEEWHRFSVTVDAFKGELARAGMDGRGQDTFGTLLACADMIEHEGWDDLRLTVPVDGEAKRWSELMAIGGMAEFEDAAENWMLCLSHLLSTRVDAWRSGSRHAVGKVLMDLWFSEDDMTEKTARSMLSQVGLGLVARPGPRNWWLAVPNQNPLTRTLFEGSKWAGDVGASVWTGALRQGPSHVQQAGKQRINGVMSAVTMISLVGLYGDGGVMAGRVE